MVRATASSTLPAEGNRLIHQAQRVAHAALRCSRDVLIAAGSKESCPARHILQAGRNQGGGNCFRLVQAA
jgi:hypothetical protein